MFSSVLVALAPYTESNTTGSFGKVGNQVKDSHKKPPSNTEYELLKLDEGSTTEHFIVHIQYFLCGGKDGGILGVYS